MRNIPEAMWDTWETGQFVGPTRPVTRATIQKAVLTSAGEMRTLLFDQTEPHYEIPNIKTCNIDRRLDADAASMQLVILNQTDIDPNTQLDVTYSGAAGGPTRRTLMDLGQPGYYTFRRGITPESEERWGHAADSTWVDMFIPNRLIRTFQGYGTDGASNPADDTNLVLTGMWLIDGVDYSANGTITIRCRDLAKLLIEQRLYPPIIPQDAYPLEFCVEHTEYTTETVPGVTTGSSTPATTGANVATHVTSGNCSARTVVCDSSVAPWYGYNGSVYGHRATHAFDGDQSSYWMSVGNSGPNQVWSYEWIEADTRGEAVNQVYFKPKWGGYVCYVSVKVAGKWQGSSVVPYGYTSEPAYPNGSNIPYVKKLNIPSGEGWVTIDLPATYNAERVRLCFTNLQDSNLGTYQYRAGVYEMQVRNYTPASSTLVTTEDTTREVTQIIPGNLNDYTDIIKLFCAWSGFYWPYGPQDPVFNLWSGASGRVWGDFFYSGAAPTEEQPCIPASFWDNKSVMDGINQIKEILGFIGYVDATGGFVWRPPNIWRTGNFITGVGYIGADSVREVSEEKVLIDYGVTVDDTNLRSEIIVVSAEDPTLYHAITPGYAEGEVIPSAVEYSGDLSLLGGQQRILLVPNYPFISLDELQKFAYLVSQRIHWSYRKGQFRVPGNPAFEPDDQVKIYERVTSEAYVHYITGVRSSMDMDKGTWYSDVQTHWLGNGPTAHWVVNTYADMPPALYAYLVAIGQIDPDTGEFIQLPDDWNPNFEIPDFPEDGGRVDDDLNSLFPDPPDVDYDVDFTWSDEDIAGTYGSGTTTPPVGGSGGNVEWRSEDWRRYYWGSPGSNLVTIKFMRKWDSRYSAFTAQERLELGTHPGQTQDVSTRVPAAAAAAYHLMAEIFADEGYNVTSGAAFQGTSRVIANTDTLSAHAWGLAIDINPGSTNTATTNAICYPGSSCFSMSTLNSTFRTCAQRIAAEIKTASGAQVFGWGGYWNTKHDWMHFEIVRALAQMDGVHR